MRVLADVIASPVAAKFNWKSICPPTVRVALLERVPTESCQPTTAQAAVVVDVFVVANSDGVL